MTQAQIDAEVAEMKAKTAMWNSLTEVFRKAGLLIDLAAEEVSKQARGK